MDYLKCIEEVYNTLCSGCICILGAGMRGNDCYRMLRDMNVNVDCFFDNNETKRGIVIDDVPVEKPIFKENVIVIVTVLNHYAELEKQLLELGYSQDMIYTYEDILATYIEKSETGVNSQDKEIREYPLTIQLPITHLCNFDCVMCGMHEMIRCKDFTVEELNKILQDKLFSKVETIGINGGEPFMRKDFVECVDVMINNCKNLKGLYIISNGYFTDAIISTLERIRVRCQKSNVSVNLSISVDAVGELQDFHRGKKGAFEKADITCKKILSREKELVDNLDIICTITNYNVRNLNEVVVWAEELGVEVAYNIATENERIQNQSRVKLFSVLEDEYNKMLAREFFYNQYQKTRSEKYYALYLYLRDGKRYAECPCMNNEWIMLTPDSQIGFCATHSRKMGSALENSAYDLVQNNLKQLKEIKDCYCMGCSHYAYKLNSDGLRELMKEKYKNENMEW